MTARPIIFSAPMIRALLAGEKTQTRRIVKRNAAGRVAFRGRNWHIGDPNAVLACPYGQPGDLLWVKETFQPILTPYFDPPDSEWATGKGYQVLYMATDKAVVYVDRDDNVTERRKPSTHMPRWASRLTLRITDVRVQRLQEISEADARAEGVTDGGCVNCGNNEPCGCANPLPCARDSFISIWYNIHGPASWLDNPHVWALTFDVIHKNVDEVTA